METRPHRRGRVCFTYRLNAAEYAALIAYEDEPALALVSWMSLRMAAVRRAVDSTKWGQPPRCIHMETLETACCCSASAASVSVFGVVAATAPSPLGTSATTDDWSGGGGGDG